MQMDLEKPCEEDYCSDDDIFLSPGKKPVKRFINNKELSAVVEGIYAEKVRKMKSCLIGIPRPPVEPVIVNFQLEDVQLFLNFNKSSQSSESVGSDKKEDFDNERNKFDVYLNLDHSCEELERLGALYIEKYLPCETLSSMSDHTAYTKLTASAKKRRRCNGWATSPGSRLSYLARRKSTFSVDQVAKLGQPGSYKQFLLQRDQIRKDLTSLPSKPKRALFQSPEEEKKRNPFRTPDLNERRRRPHFGNSNSFAPEKSSKTIRQPRSCRKSLEFSSEKNNQQNKNEYLDKHVKRKLLWAVCTALKSVSVTSAHSKFKICMNKLFKASMTLWSSKNHGRKAQQENSYSTSEAMLVVAKSLLESVVIPEIKEEDLTVKADAFDSQQSNSDYCRKSSIKFEDSSSNNVYLPSDLEEKDEKFCTISGRTLAELTNSDTSLISPNKETEMSHKELMVDNRCQLHLANTETLCSSPLRKKDANISLHFGSIKDELPCTNHKRKRALMEDDQDLMDGIADLDCYQPSKIMKNDDYLWLDNKKKLTANGT